MKTSIYFYTGTGNSLWVSRKLSQELGDTRLTPVKLCPGNPVRSAGESIGLIFPVHIWGLPQAIIDFAERLEADAQKYYFAVAVNAGQVAASLLQLGKLLAARGINLGAGFSINMPSNYIPWGGAISPEKQRKKFARAGEKITGIAAAIRSLSQVPAEKGPLWQNILFSMIYRKSLPHVPKMDRSFRADEKCTGCSVCARICPAQNISLSGGKPFWQHHCEQCFACLQWCPEEAIQYGTNTEKRKRYRHPEIKLSDMLAAVRRRPF